MTFEERLALASEIAARTPPASSSTTHATRLGDQAKEGEVAWLSAKSRSGLAKR